MLIYSFFIFLLSATSVFSSTDSGYKLIVTTSQARLKKLTGFIAKDAKLLSVVGKEIRAKRANKIVGIEWANLKLLRIRERSIVRRTATNKLTAQSYKLLSTTAGVKAYIARKNAGK